MIILASNSPRRKELLSRICTFRVCPAECEERCALTDPREFVMELARRKALAVQAEPCDTVIGADTVVWHNGKIMGKPKTCEQAASMLCELSGCTHTVYTGVAAVRNGQVHAYCETSEVTFYEADQELIAAYVESGEPMDKAGAYGIQGQGCLLVKKINGDFFNVMGLPVASLYRLLKKIGGIE